MAKPVWVVQLTGVRRGVLGGGRAPGSYEVVRNGESPPPVETSAAQLSSKMHARLFRDGKQQQQQKPATKSVIPANLSIHTCTSMACSAQAC